MRRWKWTTIAVTSLAMVTALAAAALAHEGHGEPVMGTIAKIDEGTLSLTTEGEQIVTFALTEHTVFKRGEQKVGREEARPGERAVVRYEEHDGHKLAHEVLLPQARETGE